jgi:hypothetical protein
MQPISEWEEKDIDEYYDGPRDHHLWHEGERPPSGRDRRWRRPSFDQARVD